MLQTQHKGQGQEQKQAEATLAGPAAEKNYLAEKALLKYAVILMVSGQLLGDIYQHY